MYAGLAEMEGALIGREDVGEPAIQFTANELEARIETLELALVQIERFLAAVRDEDVATVNAMLADNPRMAQTVMDDGLSALLYSHYRSRGDLVKSFLGSGLYLTIFEAAAVGDAARVGRILHWEPNLVNEFSRDGFTPLQLASYFGHDEAVRVLLERGATVEAVSRNPSRLRAIHAAAASRNAEVVRSLVAAGADVNVRQDGDFTPLMAAMENGDSDIEAILRSAGAVA
jgi:ankyrin repeat protein